MKLFRALQNKNYRLYFVGQSISLVGTWMQHVAVAWLVYRLTHSPFWLGIAAFSVQIPIFVLGPLAGVLADRWNRLRLLRVTQMLAALQALLLAVLTLSGAVTVWQVLCLAALLGTVNAFDIPARQSFFVELVGKKENYGNAIALNSSMFNLARLVGPSVGGLIMAAARANGEGFCFLINAASFLPVIGVLWALRQPRKTAVKKHPPIWHVMREGFVYAWKLLPVRAILILLYFVGMMGMPYTLLLPVYSLEILGGGPRIYGFLVASSALGAMFGALLLASRKNPAGLEKKIALSAAVFAAGLITFSQYHYLPLAMLILFGIGFSLMVMMASCNTVLQTIVDDDKRGRVMSFYTMSFMGAAPFGNLLFGSLAHRIGAPTTLLAGGIACATAALFFAVQLRPIIAAVRPIYVRHGLLKDELAAGLQTATELSNVAKD